MTKHDDENPGDTIPNPPNLPEQSQAQETSKPLKGKKKFEKVIDKGDSELLKEKEREKLEQLKEKEKQADKISSESAISKTQSEIQLRRELLKIYANDAFIGLGIFVIFVATSILIHLVASIGGPLGILIRIVGWTISGLGAICSICLAFRNAYDFIKLLIIGPPKETSRPEVAGERRIE